MNVFRRLLLNSCEGPTNTPPALATYRATLAIRLEERPSLWLKGSQLQT